MATNWKNKFEKLRSAGHKGANRAKAMATTAKPLAFSGAGGAGAHYAAKMAAEKIDFVRDNWYGKGAVLGVLALLLSKKQHQVALGIAGAAGYALAQEYDAKSQREKAGGSSGSSAGGSSAGGGNTSGYLDAPGFDTGELVMDTGAFV